MGAAQAGMWFGQLGQLAARDAQDGKTALMMARNKHVINLLKVGMAQARGDGCARAIAACTGALPLVLL